MYFVGIDISKFKHDCAIVDEFGDVITPSWSFQNDREGFSLLKELLDALDGEKKIPSSFMTSFYSASSISFFIRQSIFVKRFTELEPRFTSSQDSSYPM